MVMWDLWRKISAGEGFLQVLRFLLPIFIPPVAQQSPSSIIWGWYNRSVVATVPSGLSLTSLRMIKKIIVKITVGGSSRTKPMYVIFVITY
jgi:hypothetical protein